MSTLPTATTYDIILVWAWIMSATLATLLHELEPTLRIALYERADAPATESSKVMHNAGTGHSAYCELNYTPYKDGKIDISKAIQIAESFEISKQFRAYLWTQWYYTDPSTFINQVPHCSVVFGKEDQAFLQDRYDALQSSPLFSDMKYSQDFETISQWMSLVTNGRDASMPLAATKMDIGTDVNFGALTAMMLDTLSSTKTVDVYYNHHIIDLQKAKNNTDWTLTIKTTNDTSFTVSASKVFVWAGGWALKLLQKSRISEIDWYWGFPVSGQRLVCTNPDVVSQHTVKVYGKASVWSPPMSVPHLDLRYIDGQNQLLFGPFAGFTTKFLIHGSWKDLFASITTKNIGTMLRAWLDNMSLTRYLIKEICKWQSKRIKDLQQYYPQAKSADWKLYNAGYRVQIMKNDPIKWPILQFGTEVIVSQDKSIAWLLWASPWASTATQIMLEVITKMFPDYNTSNRLQNILPSYGTSLHEDPGLLQTVRKASHEVLWIRELF